VGCEHEQYERDRGGKEMPPVLEEEFRHVPSVPEEVSRVCDRSVPKVRRSWRGIGTDS
jgi:hypothetical protein